MTFDGYYLLAWIVGLAFLYYCYWLAVQWAEAERITEDHPEAVTGLDRLQAEGYAAYVGRDTERHAA